MVFKMRALPWHRRVFTWRSVWSRLPSYGETWRWSRGDGKKTLRTFFCGLSGHKLSIVTKVQHYPPGLRSNMNCELCWYRAEKFTPIQDAESLHRPLAYVTAMSAGAGMEKWDR